MNDKLASFPCIACGFCCQKVALSEQTLWLDRGDGICRPYDEQTKLCTIYETRPLVCRVDDYYQVHLADKIAWHDFVKINIEICRQFQSE